MKRILIITGLLFIAQNIKSAMDKDGRISMPSRSRLALSTDKENATSSAKKARSQAPLSSQSDNTRQTPPFAINPLTNQPLSLIHANVFPEFAVAAIHYPALAKKTCNDVSIKGFLMREEMERYKILGHEASDRDQLNYFVPKFLYAPIYLKIYAQTACPFTSIYAASSNLPQANPLNDAMRYGYEFAH